jgi:hypothetical protein
LSSEKKFRTENSQICKRKYLYFTYLLGIKQKRFHIKYNNVKTECGDSFGLKNNPSVLLSPPSQKTKCLKVLD